MKYSSQEIDKVNDLKDRLLHTCTVCHGRGHLISGNDVIPCQCVKIYRYLYKLILARVSTSYWTLYYKTLKVSDSYKKLLHTYFQNFESAIAQGLGIAFLGPNGVGKTSMACEVAKYAIASRNHKVLYITAEQYITALTSDLNLVEAAQSCAVLILDEIDKPYIKSNSLYVPQKIEDLLRSCFSRNQVVITCANSTEDELKELYGDSLISAMKRYLKLVPISGEDLSEQVHDRWTELLRSDVDFYNENVVRYAELLYQNCYAE